MRWFGGIGAKRGCQPGWKGWKGSPISAVIRVTRAIPLTCRRGSNSSNLVMMRKPVAEAVARCWLAELS